MDNPHDSSYRPGGIGSEVVKVKKRTIKTLPIDGEKLKRAILSKGYITEISEELGYEKAYLSQTCKYGRITQSAALLLEKMYGIKYEDYKPEEKKEDPIEEPRHLETEVVTKTESALKTIISQLAVLNNNILAMNSLLERIDKDIKVWEE